jgi:hypothetical protein
MTVFIWKISEITSEDGAITHAKYHVTAEDNGDIVETEGHWWFNDKAVKTPFNEVTQTDVAAWIEKETTQNGVNSIKSQLQSQMDYIKKGVNNELPWGNQVFKVKF